MTVLAISINFITIIRYLMKFCLFIHFCSLSDKMIYLNNRRNNVGKKIKPFEAFWLLTSTLFNVKNRPNDSPVKRTYLHLLKTPLFTVWARRRLIMIYDLFPLGFIINEQMIYLSTVILKIAIMYFTMLLPYMSLCPYYMDKMAFIISCFFL